MGSAMDRVPLQGWELPASASIQLVVSRRLHFLPQHKGFCQIFVDQALTNGYSASQNQPTNQPTNHELFNHVYSTKPFGSMNK